MEKLIALSFLLIVLVTGYRCETAERCKYRPAPIFEAGLPNVDRYQYEQKGRQSLESLALSTGVLLDIFQDVCDQTRQEYRFTVPAPGAQYAQRPDSLWMKEASRQLFFLSTLSPKQAPLRAWADALEKARPDMKLGAPYSIGEGITISVDRVLGAEQSTLLVVFYQE
ncbi:MAG: hypothetical protein ACR2K1_01975 [Saprospiraceae bacterium]